MNYFDGLDLPQGGVKRLSNAEGRSAQKARYSGVAIPRPDQTISLDWSGDRRVVGTRHDGEVYTPRPHPVSPRGPSSLDYSAPRNGFHKHAEGSRSAAASFGTRLGSRPRPGGGLGPRNTFRDRRRPDHDSPMTGSASSSSYSTAQEDSPRVAAHAFYGHARKQQSRPLLWDKSPKSTPELSMRIGARATTLVDDSSGEDAAQDEIQDDDEILSTPLARPEEQVNAHSARRDGQEDGSDAQPSILGIADRRFSGRHRDAHQADSAAKPHIPQARPLVIRPLQGPSFSGLSRGEPSSQDDVSKVTTFNFQSVIAGVQIVADSTGIGRRIGHEIVLATEGSSIKKSEPVLRIPIKNSKWRHHQTVVSVKYLDEDLILQASIAFVNQIESSQCLAFLRCNSIISEESTIVAVEYKASRKVALESERHARHDRASSPLLFSSNARDTCHSTPLVKEPIDAVDFLLKRPARTQAQPQVRPKLQPQPRPRPLRQSSRTTSQPLLTNRAEISDDDLPSLTLTERVRRRRQSSQTIRLDEWMDVYKDDQVVVTYPEHSNRPITITGSDLRRFRPGEFLNDTIIAFGLEWTQQQLEIGPKSDLPSAGDTALSRDNIHIFNSFFFEKLMECDKGGRLVENYQKVRRWTAKVDIFEKRYLIIPINEHLHWYLAIISNPGQVLSSKPALHPSPAKKKLKRSPRKAASEDSTAMQDILASKPNSRATSPDMPADPMLKIPATDKDEKDDSMIIDQTSKNEAITEIPASQTADTANDTGAESDFDVLLNLPSTPIRLRRKAGSLSIMAADNKTDQIVILSPDKLNAPTPEERAETSAFHKCNIVILDSLGTRHNRSFGLLRRWLEAEARDKKKLDVELSSETIPGTHANVPGQPNASDCGIYLLHYVETFLKNDRLLLKKIWTDTHQPRRSSLSLTSPDLWLGDQVVTKRELFSHIIQSLLPVKTGGKENGTKARSEEEEQ